MWSEKPKEFAKMVEKAVELYNDTPKSSRLGSPKRLWSSSPRMWSQLVQLQRQQREEPNRRTRGWRVARNFWVGDCVWMWDTRVQTQKDKLEPWWKGPGILVGQVSKSVWRVRGPSGKVWVRHSDMLRPYRV